MKSKILPELQRVIIRANFRIKNAEFKHAIFELENALELLPNDVTIMRKMVLLNAKIGNMETALRMARDLVQLSSSEENLLLLLKILIASRKYEEAYDFISQIEHLPNLRKYKSLLDVLSGRTDAALPNMLPELEAEFTFPLLGMYHAKQKNYTSAARYFRPFKSWKAIHAIGVMYLNLGSFDLAHKQFKDALNKYQESVGIPNMQGEVVDRLEADIAIVDDNYQSSIEVLKTYAEKYPDFNSYYALAYKEFMRSGYSQTFAKYIRSAMEYLEAGDPRIETCKLWLSSVEGDEND